MQKNMLVQFCELVTKHPTKRMSALICELRWVLKKALYPIDANEHSHLCKMNFLSVKDLIENLTMLFDASQNDEVGKSIEFPTSDEMYKPLAKEDVQKSEQCVEESKKRDANKNSNKKK